MELSTASLLKVAPADEERKIVHSLFLNTLDTKYDLCWWLVDVCYPVPFFMAHRCPFSRTVSFRSRVLPPDSVWMEDAKLKGLEICHPQVTTQREGVRRHFSTVPNMFYTKRLFLAGFPGRCLTCLFSRVQERNIFNRIFGGFLMRKAYELGWANACSYG